MAVKSLELLGTQAILHTSGEVCRTKQELLGSDAFRNVVDLCLRRLDRRDSPLLTTLGLGPARTDRVGYVASLLFELGDAQLEQLAEGPQLPVTALHEFVEGLYDFWRSLDRFMVLHGMQGSSQAAGFWPTVPRSEPS